MNPVWLSVTNHANARTVQRRRLSLLSSAWTALVTPRCLCLGCPRSRRSAPIGPVAHSVAPIERYVYGQHRVPVAPANWLLSLWPNSRASRAAASHNAIYATCLNNQSGPLFCYLSYITVRCCYVFTTFICART